MHYLGSTLYYLSPTYWCGEDNPPQQNNAQQQPVTQLQQRTVFAAERAFKAIRLAGLNVCTAMLVNLDLRNENSWMEKEYKAVWNGYTVELIQVPNDEQQELIPADDGALANLNGERALTGQEAADALVKQTFIVTVADGIEGQLTFLDHTTTLFENQGQAIENGGGRPMLEQQESSSALTRVRNAASGTLINISGGQEQAVAMQREQFHIRVTVGNIDTYLRVTFQAPAAQFTPEFIRTVVGGMVGQLTAPTQQIALNGLEHQRSLEGPLQPLLIRGPEIEERQLLIGGLERVENAAIEHVNIPRSLSLSATTPLQQGQHVAFNPLGQRGLAFNRFGIYGAASGAFWAQRGIVPLDQQHQDADNRLLEDVDQDVDAEGPEPVQQNDAPRQNRNQRNFNLLQFLFAMWGARAQRGDFFRNRNVNQQNGAQNQTWYQRLYSLFTQAISYVTQRATSAYDWWTTADPMATTRGNAGGVAFQVDMLGMEPVVPPIDRVEE